MYPIVWGSIFGGLAIVILAVGIPYYLTHRRMRSPSDTSEGRAYLDARRWWLRQRATSVPPGQTASPAQKEKRAAGRR